MFYACMLKAGSRHPVIFDTETHQSTKCYQFHLRLSLLAPPAEWQRSFSNAESSSVVHRPSGVNFSLKSS